MRENQNMRADNNPSPNIRLIRLAAIACGAALATIAPLAAWAAEPATQESFSAILSSAGPWGSALSFFLAGALLSLTPCVLPMAPILARSVCAPGQALGSRLARAASFGLGLSVCYAAAGAFAAMAGASLAGATQSPPALLGFSALLFALGLSSLGLFTVKMPAWLEERAGGASANLGQAGRLASTFAMGALTSLIAGPCVAPALAGALAYIAKTGDASSGAASLFFLAWGMILPMLAMAAGLGSILPKAGAWSGWVQKGFGAALILAAFHFAAPALGYTSPLTWALDSNVRAASQESASEAAILSPQEGQEARPGAPRFEALTSSEEFDAIAKIETRPILVYLHAAWCVACEEIKAKSFPDPRIQKLFSQARLLSVDATSMDSNAQAFMKKHGLFGPPALLAFAPGSSKPIAAIGFMEADKLAATLAPAFQDASKR